MESSLLNLGTLTSGHFRRWTQKCPPRGSGIGDRGSLPVAQLVACSLRCRVPRSLCSMGRREALATLTRTRTSRTTSLTDLFSFLDYLLFFLFIFGSSCSSSAGSRIRVLNDETFSQRERASPP
eukprot:COSAG03_NODE_1463_length_4035_cov_427.068852_6_plen_124_part_00